MIPQVAEPLFAGRWDLIGNREGQGDRAVTRERESEEAARVGAVGATGLEFLYTPPFTKHCFPRGLEQSMQRSGETLSRGFTYSV